MQLLIILALLLYGGKNNSQNLIEEVKPVLETFGGEEIKEAIKSAEEISGMLNAVKEFAGGGLFGGGEGADGAQSFGAAEQTQSDGSGTNDFFPLAPIAAIADKDITYSLSKYIANAN